MSFRCSHVRARSYDMNSPPSLPSSTRAGFAGSIQNLVLVEVQHLPARVVHAQDLVPELPVGAPAVLRSQAAVPEDVDLVGVVGRHAHVAELPAVDAEDRIEVLLVDLAPALAAVVRAVDLAADDVAAVLPGRLVVDVGVDDLRVVRRHVEAARGPSGPPAARASPSSTSAPRRSSCRGRSRVRSRAATPRRRASAGRTGPSPCRPRPCGRRSPARAARSSRRRSS